MVGDRPTFRRCCVGNIELRQMVDIRVHRGGNRKQIAGTVERDSIEPALRIAEAQCRAGRGIQFDQFVANLIAEFDQREVLVADRILSERDHLY